MELQPWANFVARDSDGDAWQYQVIPLVEVDDSLSGDGVWVIGDADEAVLESLDSEFHPADGWGSLPWDKSLVTVVRDDQGNFLRYESISEPGQGCFVYFIGDNSTASKKTEQEIQIEELKAALEDARMTLRDQFAMAALTGLLSDSETVAPMGEFAEYAYKAADAMLEARKKGGAA